MNPVRLLCFPFAAGSAALYRDWPKSLPPTVTVTAVEYPGHGRRYSQPPLADIDHLADQLAQEIVPTLDGPFVLFGHSMGALVGFELARELRRRRAALPLKIYASASRPPVRLHNRGPQLAELPDHELRGRLRRLGGTPPELLGNADLMGMMLPIVRADLAACERYVYRPEPPLPCPVTVLGGAGDRTFDQSELGQWRELTSAAFESVVMPGDHFFLRSHGAELLSWLAGDLDRLVGSA